MGASCGGAIFNTIIDTLTSLLKMGSSTVQVLSCLSSLAQSISCDLVKRDVLLVSTMRYFTEVSLSIINVKVLVVF